MNIADLCDGVEIFCRQRFIGVIFDGSVQILIIVLCTPGER